MLSAGCAKLPPEYVAPTIPHELLTCPAAPPVPDPDAATDKDVARYIVELFAAHAECWRKLGRVRELVTTPTP